ncbi:extracellular solute-binding protein [Cryptosporangium aurantiacum]|uniref:Putative spermidine/putrescine transport system substrate-binding protein n=1 Tax=Cryptosporangium aurantiacum TaxID=134849 RepID=A0A1M7MYR2_9ACTN|nr:extracellular solute-binding protein [Cryptosporangium aurantiacum]SHM96249.1 putative spermidine/putrescine transport system substrate-binding protein [Cryptosporangium aurantiacum]
MTRSRRRQEPPTSARILTTALVAAVVLAGCTGDNDGKKPVASPTKFTVPTAGPATGLGKTEGALNLVAPDGYVEAGRTDQAADWVTPFTKATGCKVEVTLTSGPDQTASLMASGRYDGVAATGDVALRLVNQGTVAPVNTALVPGYAQVAPGLKDKPWYTVDGVRFGVPVGRSANVLLWRTDVVRKPLTSWGPVYQANSPYRGQVTAPETPMTIADAALYLKTARPDLGIRSPYALTEAQLDAVVETLKAQRTLAGGYWTDYRQAVPAFTSKRVTVGQTSLAIAQLTKANGAPVQSAVPAEGSTGASTTWMLGAKAPHPNCMYKWMDHVLSPTVNAQVAEWIGVAPSTGAACARTADKSWCRTYHATDEPFWAKIAMQTAPLVDCRDGRGTTCTSYAAWVEAWKRAVG